MSRTHDKRSSLAPSRYHAQRPKGLAPWRPQAKTAALLDQVQAILEEYRAHLPLTVRQVFYRMVGAHGYDKTEQAYARLGDVLNRARRAGLVPFESLRDDGGAEKLPTCFDGKAEFWDAVRHTAQTYRRDRLELQEVYVEAWVEAAGMAPQVARVAHEFGVGVYSSGGFDSLTEKHAAAQRLIRCGKPAVVLHVGDHDPSGVSIFDAAAQDVGALVHGLRVHGLLEARSPDAFDPSAVLGFIEEAHGIADDVDFRRIIVTPEQIARYELPEAPPKDTDKRGNWTGGTVQAEALPPDVLAAEIRAALEAVLDGQVLAEVRALEDRERQELIETVEEVCPC